MKSTVHWMSAALCWIALSFFCRGLDAQGLRVYLGAPPPQPMTLVPGLYVNAGQGAMTAQQEPRAFVAKIIRVDGNQFSGELEVIRLDALGTVVRLHSTMTGSIGSAGITRSPGKIVINPTAPLTVELQDEPLRSWMADVKGNMSAAGFRLDWQTPDRQMGNDKLGNYADLIGAGADDYAQILDRYKEMGASKVQLMVFQASSAEVVRSQFNTYMQETDQVLKAPPAWGQDKVIAKAVALYKKEKALLAGHPPSDENTAPKEARLIAMQIDSYVLQVAYMNERQSDVSRYWQGRASSVSYLVSESPCMEGSPNIISYAASPACDGLVTDYDTVKKREYAVTRALGETMKPELSMECIWSAAHHALRPQVLKISDYCKKSLDFIGV